MAVILRFDKNIPQLRILMITLSDMDSTSLPITRA